jgi:YbgC/YbaW family acyl-CoA thioester hydrolase
MRSSVSAAVISVRVASGDIVDQINHGSFLWPVLCRKPGEEILQDFRFTMPYRVRVADVNYGGHVSNAAVLSFFQDARIGYLAEVGAFSELDIGGCGIILPEAHALYRAEMFLNNDLVIGVRVEQLKNSSFSMAYRIEREGVVTAEGTTALVAFDYRKRRPCRLPAVFREAIAAFEGMQEKTAEPGDA